MRWSLDGGTVYFGRIVNGRTVVMAANADGSNERQLTTALPHRNNGVVVSPDGSQVVAISTESAAPSLEIVPLDNSNTKSVLDLDGVVPTEIVNWRPPDGREIIFLGSHGGSTTELGLYRIRPDGSGLTQVATSPVVRIVPPTLFPFQGVVLSDDGREAAYWNWEPGVPGQTCHVHLLDLDTGKDQRKTYDTASDCEHWPAYLADGRLILESSDADGSTRLLMAPVDGGEVSRVPGLEMPSALGGFSLAPDRQTMIWNVWEAKDGPDRLIDIETGNVRNGLVRLPDEFSWQRRAP
jgi:Tol biopolymer transport system component